MSIVLDKLSKRFGDQRIVNNVSLEIADGELFVLLGASGSGKSTILRLIAGLSLPDGGRILLHGKDVTNLAPQPRGTGFVFQNYSIFRHMSVARNIEFGLKIRKVPSADRAKKVEELLDLVGLSGLGDRYADQISGGQQQRVALARALAYEPSVLLLDEPLGALDVKIRAQLRRTLKEIQGRLKVTTILVTHDQEEAFELGNRIGVLERGVLLEVGEPEKLYARPKSLFVASFLGASTVLVGRAEAGQAHFGPLTLPIPEDVPHEEGAPVEILFRPEQVVLTPDEPVGKLVLGKGAIVEQSFSGAFRRLRLRLPRLPGTRQISPAVPFGEEGLLVDAIVSTDTSLSNNASDQIWVSVRGWNILEQAPAQLLVVDFGTGSAAALKLTSLIAERIRASVTVLALSPDSEAAEDLKAELQRRVEEAGLKRATLNIRSGKPAEQIAAQSAGSLFEMVIIPAQADSDKGRLIAPHAIRLLERVDIPILVARGEPTAIQRILICTRTGESGKSDIRFGGRLARQLGATVTLLHITRSAEATPLGRVHLKQAASTLNALDVPNEIRTRQSLNVEEAISQEAEKHDLIVLGGHGPQSRSIFGADDIVIRVISRATKPVLVVPASEL